MHPGTRSVPIACIAFCSSIIPIHTELNPNAWAASCAYAAASVASCMENFLMMCGGKFILTLSGFMQKISNTGAFTYGWLLAASTSLSLTSGFLML